MAKARKTKKKATKAGRTKSPAKRSAGRVERIERHKDGSIRAKGHVLDGVLSGYWEWFRKDGTRLRSGHFNNGKQTGDWTTYDARGRVYKVTKMKT
jgi:antitoxin component YwqK of YwqJK toxin-antitoxin module